MKPTLFFGGMHGKNPGIGANGKSSSSRQMLRYRSHVIRRGKQQDNIHASAVTMSALSIKSLIFLAIAFSLAQHRTSTTRNRLRTIDDELLTINYCLLPISAKHQLHATGYGLSKAY